MSERVWYRSLYWRIALGFIATVAALLLAQALLFFWLVGRGAETLRTRSPQHLSNVVASDVSAALEANPTLDVREYLRAQFGEGPHRIVVTFADGRTVTSRDFTPPDWVSGFAQRRLLDSAGGSARRSRRARYPASPIVVDGRAIALVTVIPTGPRSPFALVREHGPTLAAAGVGLLALGTALMAYFVFRPAHRRLSELQGAAVAIGAGQTDVRAREGGGDEVGELAKSFNRMASDLDARAHALAEADRTRRQLLADVSHELMTPLTAMRGYLETLSMPEASGNPAARERYVRIVQEETERLEAIVGDLVDLARIEGGGAALERGMVSVQALFDRAAERHGPALADHRVSLETSVEPGADAVTGDGRRLEQVIQNLVANAVRHTPAGGRIALSSARVDGRVRLRIQDTGPGIPTEHLSRVFDRFYRVDSARDQASGGSGLGLSIVRAIVHAHGGTVSADNAPEGGARFDVLL
jgi:signal transduction histidine kinase